MGKLGYNTLMHNVIIIDPVGTFNDLLAFLGFVGGWVLKGMIGAIAAELVFRPIARRIHAKADEWEDTHPELLRLSTHYLQNHPGLHPDTGKCECKPSK